MLDAVQLSMHKVGQTGFGFRMLLPIFDADAGMLGCPSIIKGPGRWGEKQQVIWSFNRRYILLLGKVAKTGSSTRPTQPFRRAEILF